MKLNLGCGEDSREDYVNLDVRKIDGVDVQADFRKLPFNRRSFETIIAQDTLEHVHNPEYVLEECYRTLEDKGFLVFRTPDWDYLTTKKHRRMAGMEQLEKHVYGGHSNEYDVHRSLWTDSFAKRRCIKAGFKRSHIKTYRMDQRPLHWHLICIASKGGEIEPVEEWLVSQVAQALDDPLRYH